MEFVRALKSVYGVRGMIKKLLRSCIGFCLLLTVAACNDDSTIRATSGFGPTHVLAKEAYPILFEKLEIYTQGRWTGQDMPSGLLSIPEMNAGLRDGVSDIGPIIMPYFPAEYRESSLVGNLAFLGTDHRAIASAVTEYIVTCPECQAEFHRNGQVYLGADATTPYEILSTVPIRTLEDFRGVKIRTAGSVYSRFIASLGGESVQVPSTELFESLSQGVVDATCSSVPDLENNQLYDAIDFVIEIHFGVFNNAATTNASDRLWKRMIEDDRRALARAAQYAHASSLAGWARTNTLARRKALEKGIEFIQPDDALVGAIDEFRSRYLRDVSIELTQRGVVNAQAKVDRYSALVEKWDVLVKQVDTGDELAELRYREIFQNLDYSKYGM